METGLISEVVIPLLSMQNSCLLCISTLLESGNHYSRMFSMTDDHGRPVFETMSITLVCDDCMKTDHPERCEHKLHTLPRWISSSKVDIVRRLLEDDPAMLLRETLGVCSDASTKAFRSAEVDEMLARPAKDISKMYGSYVYINQTKWLFVAVDPSGGGTSAFAISVYHYTLDNEHVLVAVEALTSSVVSEQHDLLVRVCKRLRQVPGFEKCGIVFVFECNLGFEAQHLTRAIVLSGLSGWMTMSEGPKGATGWLTTNTTKEKSCLTMRSSLNRGKMWLANDFFSLTMGKEQAKRRIRDEMCRFSIITNPPKTPFQEPKRTYSGKVAGMNDDVIMAMLIGMEASVCFYSHEKYRDLAYHR